MKVSALLLLLASASAVVYVVHILMVIFVESISMAHGT